MSSPSPADQMMDLYGPNSTVPAPSSPMYSPLPQELDSFLATLLIICGVPALFLNGVVVAVGLQGWKYLKPLEIYIINMAVSDLANIIFMYPLAIPALFLHHWPWSRTVCVIYGFLSFFFGIVTMMSLTVLSVSCYLIFRSCENNNSNKRRRVFMVLAAILMYSLVMSALPLGGIGSYGLEPHATSCSLLWSEPSSRLYFWSILLMVLVLPACAMVTSNVLVAMQIRTVETHRDALGNRVFKVSSRNWGDRMFKMIMLMSSMFLLAWTPYGIFAIWQTLFEPEYATPRIISALLAVFAKCLSVNNPLVYFFLSRKLRQQAFKLFTCPNRVTAAPDPPNSSTHPVVPTMPDSHRPGVAAGIHPQRLGEGIQEWFSSLYLEDPPMTAAVEAPKSPMSTLDMEQLEPRAPTIYASTHEEMKIEDPDSCMFSDQVM